jgi:hypothetical protein
MLALSQLDFSAIPVLISAVSLTGKQTWQNVNSKRRLQRMYRKGKDISKKIHLEAFFVIVSSVLGEMFPAAEF